MKGNDLISRHNHGQEASASSLPRIETGLMELKREVITTTLGALDCRDCRLKPK